MIDRLSTTLLLLLLLLLAGPPPAVAEGLTESQAEGYACLVAGTVAMGLVAIAGPTEVAHVMGGAEIPWTPSNMYIVWTAVAAGAGALACGMAGTATPAIRHAWDALSGVPWPPATDTRPSTPSP